MELLLPRTLTCVRHGESEHNQALRMAHRGQPHPREAELMRTHTSQRRLTPRGVSQTQATGRWLYAYYVKDAQRFGETPFANVRGYVSPYARTKESAGHMNLPIEWRVDHLLAERNWGDLDQLTYEERIRLYASSLEDRELHGIYWPASNGETLQAQSTRIWQHFHMLRRRHSQHHVVQVSHGETIWTERFMLEHWLPEELVEMMVRTEQGHAKGAYDTHNKMIYCRTLQYTREREDGTWDTKYCRVRLVAPTAPDDPAYNLDWRPIVRRTFSGAELLADVARYPHFLTDLA